MVVIVHHPYHLLVFDVAGALVGQALLLHALRQLDLVYINVEAAKQVLEDSHFDNSALDVVYLPQSLNYLLLFSVEVMQHQTRCNRWPNAAAGQH